ncbi:MAG: glycine zipper 2TM domain-containing protein [Thiobacillaceae bacterium]
MKKALWLLPLALVSAGCASGLGSGDYERREARRVYEVKMGVVENVRNVRIEGTQSGVGTVAGGAVGGIAGSSVGGGKGQAIGAVLGAVAGGVAGAAAEEALTRKPGLEITVRLDSGRTIAVVQEDTGERFAVGDRVRILESGGQARVTH